MFFLSYVKFIIFFFLLSYFGSKKVNQVASVEGVPTNKITVNNGAASSPLSPLSPTTPQAASTPNSASGSSGAMPTENPQELGLKLDKFDEEFIQSNKERLKECDFTKIANKFIYFNFIKNDLIPHYTPKQESEKNYFFSHLHWLIGYERNSELFKDKMEYLCLYTINNNKQVINLRKELFSLWAKVWPLITPKVLEERPCSFGETLKEGKCVSACLQEENTESEKKEEKKYDFLSFSCQPKILSGHCEESVLKDLFLELLKNREFGIKNFLNSKLTKTCVLGGIYFYKKLSLSLSSSSSYQKDPKTGHYIVDIKQQELKVIDALDNIRPKLSFFVTPCASGTYWDQSLKKCSPLKGTGSVCSLDYECKTAGHLCCGQCGDCAEKREKNQYCKTNAQCQKGHYCGKKEQRCKSIVTVSSDHTTSYTDLGNLQEFDGDKSHYSCKDTTLVLQILKRGTRDVVYCGGKSNENVKCIQTSDCLDNLHCVGGGCKRLPFCNDDSACDKNTQYCGEKIVDGARRKICISSLKIGEECETEASKDKKCPVGYECALRSGDGKKYCSLTILNPLAKKHKEHECIANNECFSNNCSEDRQCLGKKNFEKIDSLNDRASCDSLRDIYEDIDGTGKAHYCWPVENTVKENERCFLNKDCQHYNGIAWDQDVVGRLVCSYPTKYPYTNERNYSAQKCMLSVSDKNIFSINCKPGDNDDEYNIFGENGYCYTLYGTDNGKRVDNASKCHSGVEANGRCILGNDKSEIFGYCHHPYHCKSKNCKCLSTWSEGELRDLCTSANETQLGDFLDTFLTFKEYKGPNMINIKPDILKNRIKNIYKKITENGEMSGICIP